MNADGRRKRSDDRKALAALQPASFDHFASAFRGHTGTVTNLAGALLAVRAECRLHDFRRKRGSEVPDADGGVKGRFDQGLRASPEVISRTRAPAFSLLGLA
jgi:hypothetical protein